jgi:hypothetical protein
VDFFYSRKMVSVQVNTKTKAKNLVFYTVNKLVACFKTVKTSDIHKKMDGANYFVELKTVIKVILKKVNLGTFMRCLME